ncbi:MAG TPA: hypothetical protein IAB55_05560 [Candidatus Merdivicinus faecavium]|nr:hypothetical protein [Candidatus Merdivicinus faecavium]
MVYVSAPVLDADGSLQTVILTIIDELKVGEETSFEQMAVSCDTSLDYSTSTLGDVSVYTISLF